ncbi:MAG: cupin domain-containing protein [Anaerolineales bacterium]|nr:cupin domain-containing protein [Anaerolineales bacterium]
MTDTTFFPNLADLVADAPTDSIVSRQILKDERLHAILFQFAAGQELSEHTSAFPAVLHFLDGRARLTLGDAAQTAVAGTWVHMPARLPHSIVAETPVTMLLLMLRGGTQ